jgi:hypothetical protein
MDRTRKALVVLHWVVGIGAVGGGLAGVADPTGAAVGISVEALERGPFHDFLIPGLFLMLVLGFGNVVAGILLRRRPGRPAGLISLGLFAVLVLWIVVQVYVMGVANAVWLHWLYLMVGFAGSAGAVAWMCAAMPVDSVEPPLADVGPSYLFTGQIQHLLLLAIMVPGVLMLAQAGLRGGTWMGIEDRYWLYLMLAVAILHQVVVAAVFRLQLMYQFLTRLFGRWDLVVWGCVFFPFLMLRPITLVGLGLASAGTLGLLPVVTVPAAILLAVPGVYTLWSVARWFGMGRALGGDHFRRRYREMPLVKAGAFRFSSNAMYSYAFLLLWAIALVTRSQAALAAALFQHAYIWVHWYCTEEPDMRVLYR